MSIKMTTDISVFKAKLEKAFKINVDEDVLEAIYLGAVDIVNAAKQNDTYKDQTNQLRSSLGFVIYKDGQKVRSFFEATGNNPQGQGGSLGVQKGEAVADETAQQYPQGIVCVIVAGANYALAVESRGLDVLTSHANHAVDFIQPYLADIETALKEIQAGN